MVELQEAVTHGSWLSAASCPGLAQCKGMLGRKCLSSELSISPPLVYAEMVGTRTVLWRRQWHPTPVLLPGKYHGRRSLVGCSPWSAFPLGWPWEAQSSPRVARESWGWRSSHCRVSSRDAGLLEPPERPQGGSDQERGPEKLQGCCGTSTPCPVWSWGLPLLCCPLWPWAVLASLLSHELASGGLGGRN